MKIFRLVYGNTTLPDSAIFYGGNKELKIPIVFAVYLVDTGDRKILIDAGCDSMPGFVMTNFTTPVAVMAQFGYKPEDITDAIITHAHHDHIQGIKFFPNAVVHIHEEEMDAAAAFIPEGTKLHTFRGETDVDELHIIPIGGHRKGSCIVTWENYVFVGDECYTQACFTRNIPTGVSCNREASKAFIEKYADGKYIKLFCHEDKMKTERIL